MKVDDPLGEELIRLARELEPHEISLIVGGGYGLFLKTKQLLESKERTRIDPFPSARSTEDLDFFLQAEIVSSDAKFRKIREVLDKDYEPISGAEYYQFKKKVLTSGIAQPIKVDFLAFPPESDELRKLVDVDVRRTAPKGKNRVLHAHTTEEAFLVQETAIRIRITQGSNAEIFIPHPFAYLFLKLNAVNDRIDDSVKGPYHAFDVYRIIAMMTENEWNESTSLAKRYSDHRQFEKATAIVAEQFASEDSKGVILVKRFAAQSGDKPKTDKLIADLRHLFRLS
ncbi:MAG: hypothetical protein ABI878_00905 [Acidobacteriota bacterium]